MPDIMTKNGWLDTKELSDEYEPIFCNQCGCRVGWFDTSFNEASMVVCDDCAATLSQGE